MRIVFCNKIILRFQSGIIFGMLFTSCTFSSHAQDTVLNKYGLWVLHSVEQLQQTCLHDSGKAMVNLRRAIPGIVLDLRMPARIIS